MLCILEPPNEEIKKEWMNEPTKRSLIFGDIHHGLVDSIEYQLQTT